MSIQTPPHATADSYADVAFADLYFGARLNATAWTSASTSEKEAALKTSTRRLDGELWKGRKTHSLNDNALRFPRTGLYNADQQLENSETVPAAIQQACCELAMELIKAAADEVAGSEEALINKITVGPITLGYDTNKTTAGSSIEELSGDAARLTEAYRTPNNTGVLVRA